MFVIVAVPRCIVVVKGSQRLVRKGVCVSSLLFPVKIYKERTNIMLEVVQGKGMEIPYRG